MTLSRMGIVTRLYGNTFLLTNISQLYLNCPRGDDTGNEISTVELTNVQTIYKFDCHSDTIHADEIRIVPDRICCNESVGIFNMSSIHYPINLAYLSKHFTANQLVNLAADTLLNHTLEAELPDLSIADKLPHYHPTFKHQNHLQLTNLHDNENGCFRMNTCR